MSDSREEIEEFARKLIERVRDPAVKMLMAQLTTAGPAPTATRWRRAAEAAGATAPPPSMVIPDCIDAALAFVLGEIDGGRLRLSYRTDSGDFVDLSDAGGGELAGDYEIFLQQYSRIQPSPDPK